MAEDSDGERWRPPDRSTLGEPPPGPRADLGPSVPAPPSGAGGPDVRDEANRIVGGRVLLERGRGVPADARPGDLTLRWRLALGLVWLGVFFGFAAVWQASVQIGIGTWWLGTRSQPAAVWLRMVPFVVPIAMVMLLSYNVRRVIGASAVGAIVVAAIGLADLGRSVGLGLAELVLAVMAALGTLAATTGRYRLTTIAAPDGPPGADPAASASPERSAEPAGPGR